MQRILPLSISLLLTLSTTHAAETAKTCRCEPSQACWPDAKSWSQLQQQLTGRLIKPQAELESCYKDANSKTCAKTLKAIHNPFVNENYAGNTQSQGWMNAWRNQASVYAVEAANAEDVAAAVNFAREHQLRVVIKGTGHDYLGRSNAANSLLIWTHNMRTVTYEEKFKPAGCEDIKAVPAISVGAGTRWLEAYDMATNQHNRYVQGGGCTTVGAAGGFTQGGGFGSFSKRYGTGAMGILEAEVVTADGKTLIANQCQNKDLFWALRGGGAGTYGVVTKLTLKTHALPMNFGLLRGTLKAANDDAYKKLILMFIAFYRDNMNNDHWGEQVRFNADNTITLNMTFSDLSETMARFTLAPLRKFVKDHADLYTLEDSVTIIPANKLWDYDYMSKNLPDLITLNKEKDAPANQFWWTPNSSEVSKYWFTYQSWWIPFSQFDIAHAGKLADTIYRASRLTAVNLHFNKGLSGAPASVVEACKTTASHPTTCEAAALVIMSAATNQAYPGVKGKEPDNEAGKVDADKVSAAIKLFKQLAPEAGTYVNEADYFLTGWQHAFWGSNYNKLLEIKQKYDPNGLFYCHHCVGSESWDTSGMCRV